MKPFIKILKNQAGMSLISVLAAMGILSVVIAGVMAVSQNMMKVSQSVDTKAQVQEEVFIAQSMLASEVNCTANLKGFAINSDLKPFTANSGLLKATTAPDKYILGDDYLIPSQDPNNKQTRLEVKTIKLSKYKSSDRLAMLNVDFQPKNSILGGSFKSKDIPLQVILTAAGAIVKCTASTVPGALDEPPTGPEAAAGGGGQGQGCNGGAPGAEGESAESYKAVLASVCDKQTYPVTKGLLIKESDISNCSSNCGALKQLALSERTGGGALSVATIDKDVTLKKRKGYTTAEECKAQLNFSEGDEVVSGGGVKLGNDFGGSRCNDTQKASQSYMCVNGKWAKGAYIPAEVPKCGSTASGGG